MTKGGDTGNGDTITPILTGTERLFAAVKSDTAAAYRRAWVVAGTNRVAIARRCSGRMPQHGVTYAAAHSGARIRKWVHVDGVGAGRVRPAYMK